MITDEERKRRRNAVYQARSRAKREAEGFRQLMLMLPPRVMPDFKRAAELIRANPALSVRLWDTRTGKTVGGIHK